LGNIEGSNAAIAAREGLHHPVKPVILVVEFVHLPFIAYPYIDEESACHAGRETRQVKKGKKAPFHKIAPGDGKIAFKHKKQNGSGFYGQKKCQCGSSLAINSLNPFINTRLFGFGTAGVLIYPAANPVSDGKAGNY
jgi:hypothetical protein